MCTVDLEIMQLKLVLKRQPTAQQGKPFRIGASQRSSAVCKLCDHQKSEEEHILKIKVEDISENECNADNVSKDDLKKISGVQSEEKKVEEPQSSVVKSDANKVTEKPNTGVKSDVK